MSPEQTLARIVEHPFADLMQGARLDSFIENGQDLSLEVQGLRSITSELFEREGKIIEQVTCTHIPLKLHFDKVTHLNRSDFFTSLGNFLIDDPSRIIFYMNCWQQPGMEDIFHAFKLREPVGAVINFLANKVTYEQGSGNGPFTLERDWSPAPPMPNRLVPYLKESYEQFGGDPVTVKIDGDIQEQRLFVGGLENQSNQRPQVDAVLNIGERPSLWAKGGDFHPNDRTVEKGEGTRGMSVAEIRQEANWVIDRLQNNQSVLVHCVAGMNRSTTICCAVLMLVEGLTAEEALKRIREQHPWAKPDSYHWLALRWLEKNKKE